MQLIDRLRRRLAAARADHLASLILNVMPTQEEVDALHQGYITHQQRATGAAPLPPLAWVVRWWLADNWVGLVVTTVAVAAGLATDLFAPRWLNNDIALVVLGSLVTAGVSLAHSAWGWWRERRTEKVTPCGCPECGTEAQ